MSQTVLVDTSQFVSEKRLSRLEQVQTLSCEFRHMDSFRKTWQTTATA